MTDRERIIQVFKDQIKLCGPDPEKDRWWVTMTVDDSKMIVKWLSEKDEQVPKIGHWIYLQDCANEGVYCSECHTKMFDRYPMKKKLSQFCAHCGAKMDNAIENR